MLDWSLTNRMFNRPTAGCNTEITGLIAGTQIATKFGWRPVEALCAGDLVLTFDHGFRPIKALGRTVVWDGKGTCPEAACPIRIEAGLLENEQAFDVLPDQGVMVESDAAESHRGDPFAVICARALEKGDLAERTAPQERIEAIVLEFDEDEVIYGRGGIHYFAAKPYDFLDAGPQGPSYKILDPNEIMAVVDEIWERIS